LNAALIKAKALELGFHLVGIAPARELPEAECYRQWAAQGFAGEMGYMTRNSETRADCTRLFPPARMVIVCGMSYHADEVSSTAIDHRNKGWIARYARGQDYHHVLKAKLTTLLDFIQQASSTPIDAKISVDTAPLLERLYARYAGLGWIGKHGCVINSRYGSWILLGEILINLDLEPDAPAPDRCGTCTRCLDACPSYALVAPKILDARRCIAYLTIELKGIIPEELRPAIGNKVFGCDRCQEVCPWNQRAEVSKEPIFLPEPAFYAPDLMWLWSLSPASFKHVFRDTPLLRTKLRGILRNTAIAMGNSGNPDFLPLLHQASHTTDPLVQPHLEWAIRQLTA